MGGQIWPGALLAQRARTPCGPWAPAGKPRADGEAPGAGGVTLGLHGRGGLHKGGRRMSLFGATAENICSRDLPLLTQSGCGGARIAASPLVSRLQTVGLTNLRTFLSPGRKDRSYRRRQVEARNRRRPPAVGA